MRGFPSSLAPFSRPHFVAAAGSAYIIHDEFTDTDSTNLTAHTISPVSSGLSWSTLAGSGCRIISNQAEGITSDNTHAGIECSVADVIIEGDITVQAGTNRYSHLIFRWVDSSNYWGVRIADRGSALVYAADMYKVVAGSKTFYFGAAIDIDAASSPYAIKAVCSGTNIEMFIDGVSQVSTSQSDHQTATIHGINSERAYASGGGLIDNFKITDNR